MPPPHCNSGAASMDGSLETGTGVWLEPVAFGEMVLLVGTWRKESGTVFV